LRETQETGTCIGPIDAPFDDTLRLQAPDQQACTVTIDAEAFGQTVLIDIGFSVLSVEVRQNSHIERHEIVLGEWLRYRGHADLQKAPRQWKRGSPDRRHRAFRRRR
jgi:hypothetical protein